MKIFMPVTNFDTDLTVRIDNRTKLEAQKIFDALGLDIGSAVNMFFHQVVMNNGLPFRVVVRTNEITDEELNGDDFYGLFYETRTEHLRLYS